jgi:hypothetical protein
MVIIPLNKICMWYTKANNSTSSSAQNVKYQFYRKYCDPFSSDFNLLEAVDPNNMAMIRQAYMRKYV